MSFPYFPLLQFSGFEWSIINSPKKSPLEWLIEKVCDVYSGCILQQFSIQSFNPILPLLRSRISRLNRLCTCSFDTLFDTGFPISWCLCCLTSFCYCECEESGRQDSRLSISGCNYRGWKHLLWTITSKASWGFTRDRHERQTNSRVHKQLYLIDAGCIETWIFRVRIYIPKLYGISDLEMKPYQLCCSVSLHFVEEKC